MDPSQKITIKAYDDGECFSTGVIIIPIRVGPSTENTLFEVLDIEMNCNMILGNPWIHAMKVVPSTYHQCLKFSYNNLEVTILGDPDPFQFCANLRGTTAYQVPTNQAANPLESSKHIDPSALTPAFKGKLKIADQGCGEYSMSHAFHIEKLPLSPKSYGKPQLLQNKPKFTFQKAPSMTFTSGGGLHEEHVYENTSTWIKKAIEEKVPTPISPNKYGHGFTIMQKKGYNGCSGLGPQKQGIIEPITISGQPRSLGLRFKPFVLGLPNTDSSSSKNVNASNDDKASENNQTEPTQPISDIDDLDTSLDLDHLFTDPYSLPVEDKHVIPPIPQNNSSP